MAVAPLPTLLLKAEQKKEHFPKALL